ncbi:hypothetical protein BVY03_04245 [bacterium K02(2017)]|nr:hypothetical protein BVY03_04245 [bacterium K02(2017)]
MNELKRPYADQEFYDGVMKAGFESFPERKANYLRFKEAERGAVLDHLPVKLDVENVSRCNFHCTMCQVSDWEGLKRARDMDLEEFKKLMDEQIGLVEIKLQGMGEPLMGKSYFEMIKYARERHIWVRSTTNASLLHVNENYKKIIDSDVCELQVSVDGATAETYEKIRRGGRFKRMMENCSLLNSYAKSVNKMRTRMWVVVQKDNFNELEKFPALAAELGFERLSFSLDLTDWGQDEWKSQNDQVDMHKQFDVDIANRLTKLGEDRNLDVTFWFIDDKYNTSSKDKLCPWPFERAYVSSDMKIVPCCMIANPEISNLGDANNFSSEWNNKNMQEFRQAHIDGKVPHVCKSCYKLN